MVEDSAYLADSLIDLLEMSGLDTLHAHSGTEGVSIALSQHPDLVLLDIRLPDISGYEVYRQIRDDDWGKTARIIILTASESVEVISQHVDLPLEYVLFKPEWSMQELQKKILDRLTTP